MRVREPTYLESIREDDAPPWWIRSRWIDILLAVGYFPTEWANKMNCKMVLGLAALLATASAVQLGPYSIDYDEMDSAIWIPIPPAEDFLYNASHAGVILTEDAWVLISCSSDFDKAAGINASDAGAPLLGDTIIITEHVTFDSNEGFFSSTLGEHRIYRAVWTLDGGFGSDGILYGSDVISVTMGGWDQEEVERFLESIQVTKTGQQETSEPEPPEERANVPEGTVVLGDSSTAARWAAYREAGLQTEYLDVVPV